VKLREAFIAVTYACNARCQMCNIWKTPPTKVLPPEEYAKLPRSLRTINITGGEPFLRRDLVEVVRTIHSVVPTARFVFSTNGLMTENVLSQMERIRAFHPRVGVGVSIDGLEPTHDSIRGVPGIFTRAIATVKKLKEAGFDDLRIAMTLSEGNVREVMQVFELSRTLGVEFTMTLVHDSDLYFRTSNNVSSGLLDAVARELPAVLRCQLRSRHVKDWFRAYHTQGILDPSHRKRYISNCEAGQRYFFMSPEGDVYPCNVLSEKIGNLSSVKTWDELFTRDAQTNIRRVVRSCRRDCWMVCNARSLMIAHPVRTTAWVVKSKIKSHLRSDTVPSR
jgi:radical SAM protein with 4Fe4S-binding SPASM domain